MLRAAWSRYVEPKRQITTRKGVKYIIEELIVEQPQPQAGSHVWHHRIFFSIFHISQRRMVCRGVWLLQRQVNSQTHVSILSSAAALNGTMGWCVICWS